MIEYRFHWWRPAPTGTPAPVFDPVFTAEAPSTLHGAALALQHFVSLGYDVSAPLAHVDVTEANGAKHMVLVEEVLDWLRAPEQTAFVEREHLTTLVR